MSSEGYDRWSLKDESTIDYGYMAKTGGTKIAEEGDGYYITTAINYTNGPAHMGHAYEAATSDVIARFERLKGEKPAYFVTGADEHGQKIADTAEGKGKVPQDICDQVCYSKLQVTDVFFNDSLTNIFLFLRIVFNWIQMSESENFDFK